MIKKNFQAENKGPGGPGTGKAPGPLVLDPTKNREPVPAPGPAKNSRYIYALNDGTMMAV